MSVNFQAPDFDEEEDRPGFAVRGVQVGRHAGAEQLGASLYELPPGQAICPYHAHLANEELLIALAGRASLRTPQGWRELQPGEVVSFPAGLEGSHQVANFSDGDARVLMISEMVAPEVAIYPDSGKVLAREHPPGRRPGVGFRMLFHEADTIDDYWEGEGPPSRTPGS